MSGYWTLSKIRRFRADDGIVWMLCIKLNIIFKSFNNKYYLRLIIDKKQFHQYDYNYPVQTSINNKNCKLSVVFASYLAYNEVTIKHLHDSHKRPV